MNLEALEPHAPGEPGKEPGWTAGAKTGVGTSLDPSSRVWFTIGQGVVTEVYYRSVDNACIRELKFAITAGEEFFSDEKEDTDSKQSWYGDGIPCFTVENTCGRGQYQLVKEVLSGPRLSVVCLRAHFKPLRGGLENYSLFALLTPQLDNHNWGNTAWVDDFRGVPMMFATRGETFLAFACSVPWLERTAGFYGVSDGEQDLRRNRRLTGLYRRAPEGHVALTGRIDLDACGGDFEVVLAFGASLAEAGTQARMAMMPGYFEEARRIYTSDWKHWQESLAALEQLRSANDRALVRTSAAMLRIHEDKNVVGSVIASLSVPWGFAMGDAFGRDRKAWALGYHFVWPRDLGESAGALLALGDGDYVRRILSFLQAAQEEDGHWAQDMWANGQPHWKAIQLCETALPVLLLNLAHREGFVEDVLWEQLWPMVRKAVGFIVRRGPVTEEDRWERSSGYTPFTLGAVIAALLVGADLAKAVGEPGVAQLLRETADEWNSRIEDWIYARGTELARKVGVEGYYVRIAAQRADTSESRLSEHDSHEADVVSPDALALVRFGLRSPDDPKIINTVKVIDATLKVELPTGVAWRRYTGDQYGEYPDGSPFDGSGVGRAWPLLVGERAHYELAAGRVSEAKDLLRTMERQAGDPGLLPEQIWDQDDIPARRLVKGRATGSAMPLVWAHSEYIKLCRSLQDGRVFDMPPQTVERYREGKTPSEICTWRFEQKLDTIPAGKVLRILTLAPARVRWTIDDWKSSREQETEHRQLGVNTLDIETGSGEESTVVFTFYWPESGCWEERDFSVRLEGSSDLDMKDAAVKRAG